MSVFSEETILVTSGSNYLDIDAYAGIVAMTELLELQGKSAVAYSKASFNYSVCDSIVDCGSISSVLPEDCSADDVRFIIVDVSDPGYLEKIVSIEKVIAVYDHHVGFEEYWKSLL